MPEDTRDEKELALISRMLTYRRASGESIQDTLRKLSSNLPDSYHDSINDVKSITSGDDGVLKKYKSERFSLLVKLMAVVRKEGGDTSTLLVSIHNSISEGIDHADSYWEGFQSVMSYLIAVFVVAILVVTIFVLKVLPQFRVAFNDFGVELPEFTRLVLENDFALLIVIFLFAVCAAGFSLLYFHVKRQDKILTIRPIVVIDSSSSPFFWLYGSAPNGMAPVGEDRTDIDKSLLPVAC